MSDNKKGSSYERIYQALLDTTEGKGIQARVKQAIENVRVTGYQFKLNSSDDGRPVAVPHFTTNWAKERSFTKNNIYCSVYDLFTTEEFNAIVEAHFEKDVKTFFCRKDTVLKGCRDERGRKHISSFAAWAGTQIENLTADIRDAAVIRLESQATELASTADFLQDRHNALLRFCHDEVVQVMSRYAFLGTDVLKGALKEFCVADVMEA